MGGDVAGPLDDITVLEIANWVAAPSCAALMADMGARVVKVEPLGGDGMRGKLRQPRSDATEVVAADVPFHLDNRGKRSVAVDLRDDRGAEVVRALAAEADVVVTNLLPDRLRRFGLGPEQLRAANPRLVYALVTGYGSTGDDADRIAFDLTAFFARSGIMSLIGQPEEPPPAFRPGQGDHPTGLALLVAVLAALRARDRTGEGQVVETALMRTAAWTIGCDVATALVDRVQPARRARTEAFSPMNNQYRCADGTWLNVSAQDQRLWGSFCDAIGRPDLGADERYDTPAKRYREGAHLVAVLDGHFATGGADHWASLLDGSGVVWSRVAELPDLVDDPQARATGMFTPVEHPVIGTFETLAAPFTLSGSEVAVRGRAPEVGEHTAEVLAGAGVDEERLAALARDGVIAGPGT
jgi:crotonobetainyl-CoA:carnitine CoA-transferase CaiB-like acyl-CoA transferase